MLINTVKRICCIHSVLEPDEEDTCTDIVLLNSLANRADECVSFIPVVADEAIWMNYYDSKYRGGLFYRDYVNETAIQKLCWGKSQMCHDIIRRLQEMDLLKKEDIRGQDLLFNFGDPELIVFFQTGIRVH